MFYRAYSSLFLAESILFSVWTLSVHKLPGPFVWQQAHFFTHYSFLGPDWCQVLHIESDSPIIWILAKLESIHGNDMSKMGQRAFWSSRCGTVVCATCTLTEFIWFQKCIAALFTNVRNTFLFIAMQHLTDDLYRSLLSFLFCRTLLELNTNCITGQVKL